MMDLNLFENAFRFAFPSEWVKAALVLSFFSTGVVIGVFAYLNRYTRKPYFSLWTASWIFFELWLAAAIGLEETPDAQFLVFVRRACIGASALCMFWGSFEMTGAQRRSRRELSLGLLLMVVWSYIAVYQVRDPLWITLPVFMLLGTASLYTGSLFNRLRSRYSGAGMLAGGFLLLGLQFGMNPFLEQSTTIVQTVSYVVMSVLAIFIALGMVVQVLEQGKEQNEMLLHEFRRGMMTRQLLEQEVTLSETKYRALYDSASDAIFLVDLETMEVLEANTSATQLLGGRSARGQEHFLNLCPNLRGSDGTILQNKRMFDEVFGPSKEFLMTRLNGSTVACEGSANLVQYNKRPVLQLNVREITERKRLEQQLRQSEKLSALGQLVAGVAHELNNPLAVIMGYAQLLAKQKDHDPKLKTDVLKILRESERAAKIVRNLLTFARPREPQMTSVDINRLIAGVIETHEAELNACSIHINARLVPDLPATVADPHQLEQVFTNLFMNAVQALQEQPVPRTIEVVTQLDGQTIRIAVSDNGPGISPEIVSKIFDPFFTTKPPGKGTGLGLSISHSIIQEHRGRIWVQSERGKGAKFHVELPLIRRTAETSCEPVGSDETKLAPPSQSNASRLLVVDDEPGIVEVLCCALSDSGFNVDTANNGNQALERIADNRYDVIISDLCMPGTDGEMLYKRVRESDPDLARRIIFVTGDTVSVKSRTFLEWTGNRWFSKPFNIAELEKAVVNFLDSEPISSK